MWRRQKTGTWLLLDVFRQRLDYPSLKRKVTELRGRWRAETVIVETANPGFALWQEFRNERRGMLEGYKPLLSKEVRFETQLAKIEDGKVALLREAHWLPEFKRELQGFPQMRHDDQVDSVSQFLDWTGRRNVIPGIERRLGRGMLRPQSVKRPARVVR
ncbi:phage terminase large subunit [Enterovirga sp. CN4-39]|uniref:phage terminase large subunit n=1 Tax=Enterovirga sp. CN4-39 TaxID=3400910 RepID=UPI003C0BB3BE